jgi:ABC-type amino acid transport substrate-binding protein
MSAMLIVGLIVGFGIGYFTPTLIASDDYDVIMTRGYIVVGTNSGWPPFEMINATTSELYGFDIDLAEMVGDYLGVNVTYIDMQFDALIAACQGGTIDMIASATFVTPERCAVLQPLEWYIRTNEVIVTKTTFSALDNMTSLDNLTGYDVGVQLGTTEDEELTDITGVVLHRYPLVETMFEDLDSGALDAVYVDEPIVGLYGGIYSIKIIFTVTAPPTAFYIRYGSDRLSAAINSAISEGFADGTIDALIAKWFA